MANLIAHFECHMTRRIPSREKEEQIIEDVSWNIFKTGRHIHLHQHNKELPTKAY
jgi:hypothetical protein